MVRDEPVLDEINEESMHDFSEDDALFEVVDSFLESGTPSLSSDLKEEEKTISELLPDVDMLSSPWNGNWVEPGDLGRDDMEQDDNDDLGSSCRGDVAGKDNGRDVTGRDEDEDSDERDECEDDDFTLL
nr:hypothetical protein BaRGS_021157 [Batillaria attramentaria]